MTFGTITNFGPSEYERRLEEFKLQLQKELQEKEEAEKLRLEEQEKQMRAEIEKRRRDEKERLRQEEIEKKRVEDAKLRKELAEKRKREEERLRLQEEERSAAFTRELEEQAEENERERQQELRDREERDRQRAAEKKKGKEKERLVLIDEADSDFEPEADSADEVDVESDEEIPVVKPGPQSKKGKQTTITEAEFIAAFNRHGFTGTAYPDLQTIERLGLIEDYNNLVAACGLQKYAEMREFTYPAAASEFLATVTYHEMTSKSLRAKWSGGYITFEINGVGHDLSLRDLEELFGFPTGQPTSMVIAKETQNMVWKMLTGEEKFESGVKKGIRIRSPPIALVRKVIAETFCCRAKTGPSRAGDLNVLIRGLEKLLGFYPGTNTLIEGDSSGAGLAYVLVRYLESYRGKMSTNIKRGTSIMPVTIGGPITAILKLAEADVDWDSDDVEKIPPRVMDLKFLQEQCFLTGPITGDYFSYKVQLPDQPEMIFTLPNIELTRLSRAKNALFIPPPELLIDPKTVSGFQSAAIADRAAVSSAKKKKAPPAVKETAQHAVPMTKAQRQSLKEELRAEIKAELLAEIIEHMGTEDYKEELMGYAKLNLPKITWGQLRTNLLRKLEPMMEEIIVSTVKNDLLPDIVTAVTPAVVTAMTPSVTKQVEEHLREQLKTKRTAESDHRTPTSAAAPRPRPTPPSLGAPGRIHIGSATSSTPARNVVKLPKRLLATTEAVDSPPQAKKRTTTSSSAQHRT